MGAGVKGSQDLWVNIDQQVLLLSHLCVSAVDLLLDPDAEVLADTRIGNVDQPLLGYLWDLLLDGQALPGLVVGLDKLEDVRRPEALIVG